MGLFPAEILLMYIKKGSVLEDGDYQIPSRAAIFSELRTITGQDFGEDVARWEQWIQNEYGALRQCAIDSIDPEE